MGFTCKLHTNQLSDPNANYTLFTQSVATSLGFTWKLHEHRLFGPNVNYTITQLHICQLVTDSTPLVIFVV